MLKIDEPETNSGYHMIQPNKDKPPFNVFCNMEYKNGAGVTTFSHDSEKSTHVNGYEDKGKYRKKYHIRLDHGTNRKCYQCVSVLRTVYQMVL